MYLFDIALEDNEVYGNTEVTAKDLLDLELAAEEVRVAESDARELVSAIDRSGKIVAASEARVSTLRSISSTNVDSTIATLAIESLRDTASALGYKAIDKDMLVSMEEAKENDPYTTLATALEEEKGMVRKAKDFLVGLLKKVIAKIKTLGLKLAKAVTASVKSFEDLRMDLDKVKVKEIELDDKGKKELVTRFGAATAVSKEYIELSLDLVSEKTNVDDAKSMRSIFNIMTKDIGKAVAVLSKLHNKNDSETMKKLGSSLPDKDINDLEYYRIARIDNSKIALVGVEKKEEKYNLIYRNIAVKLTSGGDSLKKVKVSEVIDGIDKGKKVSENFDKLLTNVNGIAKVGDEIIKSESGEGEDSIKKDFISVYSKYGLDAAVGAYKTLNNIKWLAKEVIKKAGNKDDKKKDDDKKEDK